MNYTSLRESGHCSQTDGRVRHQLRVNQRSLDASVSQPPAEVIERDPAQQQVTGVTVPQSVRAGHVLTGQLRRPAAPPTEPTDRPLSGKRRSWAASDRAVTSGGDKSSL